MEESINSFDDCCNCNRNLGSCILLYNFFKPMNEVNEEMESKGASGSTPSLVDDVEEEFFQNILVQIIGFLTVVFCITTVLSYIVIERLRKRKNKKS